MVPKSGIKRTTARCQSRPCAASWRRRATRLPSTPVLLLGWCSGDECPRRGLVGALLTGATGAGIWAMAPSHLTERFPTAVRGVGPGLSYHVGAAVGAMTPFVLGHLQDGGMTTSGAMALCIATSGLLVAAMIWMGPETRGRQFTATDEPSIAGEGCS